MSQKMSNRVPQLSPALESIGNISNITYKSVKTPDSLKAQRFDQAYSYDVFRFINKLKTNKIWGSSDVAKGICVFISFEYVICFLYPYTILNIFDLYICVSEYNLYEYRYVCFIERCYI